MEWEVVWALGLYGVCVLWKRNACGVCSFGGSGVTESKLIRVPGILQTKVYRYVICQGHATADQNWSGASLFFISFPFFIVSPLLGWSLIASIVQAAWRCLVALALRLVDLRHALLSVFASTHYWRGFVSTFAPKQGHSITYVTTTFPLRWSIDEARVLRYV